MKGRNVHLAGCKQCSCPVILVLVSKTIGEEGIKILLENICLATVEEVKYGTQVFRLQTSDKNERVWVGVSFKQPLEERT